MGCVTVSVLGIALHLNGKGNFSFGRLSFFFSFFFLLLIFVFKLQKYVLGKISNDSVDFVGFSLRAIPVKRGKIPTLI